ASKTGRSPRPPDTRIAIGSRSGARSRRALICFSRAGSLVFHTRRPSFTPSIGLSGPRHTKASSPRPARSTASPPTTIPHTPPPADAALARDPPLDEEPAAARDLRRGAHEEVPPAVDRALADELAREAPAVIAGARLDEPLVIDPREEPRAGAPRVRLERRAP